MTDDTTDQEKIDRPHAFFHNPQQVVTEPTLSKEQKTEALDALEQDARQLAAASDEGMAGGERNKLQDVLDAKDSLELSPTAFAYQAVQRDLQSKAKTDVTGDARALVEQALAALEAVMKSPILKHCPRGTVQATWLRSPAGRSLPECATLSNISTAPLR